MLILVATDASAFVSYITRFTEENFATLIALIFMVEAVKNVMLIRHGPSVSSLKMLDPNDTSDNETHFITIAENVTKPWAWDYEIDSDDPPNDNVRKRFFLYTRIREFWDLMPFFFCLTRPGRTPTTTTVTRIRVFASPHSSRNAASQSSSCRSSSLPALFSSPTFSKNFETPPFSRLVSGT